MALMLLTGKDPENAIRAVFARCGFLLIPLSVLFIKYYPDLGRGFSSFTGTVQYQGVAIGKNNLGVGVLVLALFLILDTIEVLKGKAKSSGKSDIVCHFVVLVMALWLLRISNSVTSLICAVIGSAGLVVLNMQFVQKRLKHAFAWSAMAAVVLVVVSGVVDLKAAVAGMVGRDPKLHGRSELWQYVLSEGTNPLVGTGFSSFWLGTRPAKIQAKTGQFYLLNQAHNGYLEIYLNGGVIGLGLILTLLVAAGKNIQQQLLFDPSWAGMRLVIWLIVLFHNWSEATFCRLNVLWFVLIVAVIEAPRSQKRNVADQEERLPESIAVAHRESPSGLPVATT